MIRTLSLKRDVLRELTSGELGAVAGAAATNTDMSCLDYISCWAAQCTFTLRMCPGGESFPRCE